MNEALANTEYGFEHYTLMQFGVGFYDFEVVTSNNGAKTEEELVLFGFSFSAVVTRTGITGYGLVGANMGGENWTDDVEMPAADFALAYAKAMELIEWLQRVHKMESYELGLPERIV